MKTNKTITLVTDEKLTLKGTEVFVTMTDKFLSGWGCAEGKTAKRVIICENRQQAETVRDRLYNPKHGMIYVNITYTLPYYTPGKYTTSFDKFFKDIFNF